MLVMPANNAKWQVHYWQGLYGGLGHLYSPGAERGPYPHLPYALDNGAFPAWAKGITWDETAWLRLIQWAASQEQKPIWMIVPDVVGNKKATLENWEKYEPVADLYLPGIPKAFAVQDGMTASDVPESASVVFVGGSTEWKWETAEMWCKKFRRVHIGRVNSYDKLKAASRFGCESTDGTGWFRGDKHQLRGLERFLSEQKTGVKDISVVAPFTKRSSKISDGQSTLFKDAKWRQCGTALMA